MARRSIARRLTSASIAIALTASVGIQPALGKGGPAPAVRDVAYGAALECERPNAWPAGAHRLDRTCPVSTEAHAQGAARSSRQWRLAQSAAHGVRQAQPAGRCIQLLALLRK